MGRPRKKPKKPPISTRTAIVLAGSAVAFAVLLGMIWMLRGPGFPRGRDFRPPPVVRTADEAWKLLQGKWGQTIRAGNGVSKVEYEFTADRRMIFRSSLSGGVLPQPQTNEIVSKIVAIDLDDDDILLTVEGGQGEMLLWFDSPTVLVVEGEEFRRKD